MILSDSIQSPVVISGVSFTIFFLLDQILILNNWMPKKLTSEKLVSWRWRHQLENLIHSCITGVFSSIRFYYKRDDLNQRDFNEDDISMLVLLSLSVGFFIYDLISLLKNEFRFKAVLHHVCVLLGFGICCLYRSYLNFCAFGLVMECNAILFYLRQLLVSQNGKHFRHSKAYLTLTYLFLATFILIRVPVLIQMLSIVSAQDLVHMGFWEITFARICVVTLTLHNVIMFLIILRNDILSPKPEVVKW